MLQDNNLGRLHILVELKLVLCAFCNGRAYQYGFLLTRK